MSFFFIYLFPSAKEYCKVTFTFEATNEDELSLKEGDIIHILSKVSDTTLVFLSLSCAL